MQQDGYLPELARYVVLDPVRARMARTSGQWPWTGYRAVVGQAAAPPAQPFADYARIHPERDDAIAAAFASGGYTLRDIGDYFGLH